MNEQRRKFLLRALALGWLAGGSGWNKAALASAFGKVPERLPEGRSVYKFRGEVTVNGRPVTMYTRIGPNDTIVTGRDSYLIAAVGQDALLLRELTRLELNAKARLRQGLRLVTGAMLGVFRKRLGDERLNITTPVATIGIRGTGVYAESRPERTYFCTCYGVTDIAHTASPERIERVTSAHHDAPRWVLAAPEQGKHVMPSPMHSHNDLELITLEALVGREVPFGEAGRIYQTPRWPR
ncbi:MAG: hypothetical protein ACREVW_03745 [Burkholderiales bacterium]